ncbi:MAG TPA: hypothetical protein VFJ58_12670 [Armatimonadota bacterium]|nr:hypothetical protein [Armatimonadota bacterium]
MNTFQQLLKRRDTRREIIGAAIILALILALALSRRTPAMAPVPDFASPRVIATDHVRFGTVDLMQIQNCPGRRVSEAVVRFRGPMALLTGDRDPVDDAGLASATLDGGEWTGVARVPAVVSYAGAGGELERRRLNPGDALAVLRFRGAIPIGPVNLWLVVKGQRIDFHPGTPAWVPDRSPAPSFGFGR